MANKIDPRKGAPVADTPQQVAKNASLKKALFGDLMQTIGILPILVLIVAVFGFITPNFFTESNLLNIARQSSINIVLAAGMTFIILTGGIDLSVGSILGTTAVTAMVVSLMPGWESLSIPAALMMGTGLGLFNGMLVAWAGLPPFIVTLGTYTALRGAAYLLADGTTVINSNINFEWIGNSYLGPIPWLVVIALAVIVVCWFILRRTTLGVHIYAVGGNMQAARLTGIKVWMVLLFVYGMSGPALRARRRDERLAAIQRQRQPRDGLRAGRHRGGDPRRHQLCGRHRHHHRHPGRGADYRHA